MGSTIGILPSHASTKTSSTWKFGAFYPNARLTHMEPENLSPLQLLLATRIRHRCGLRASSNNSHHTLLRQVNGLNSSHPPFTCLDENIKNMEVWSVLSKYFEQVLLKIQTNMKPFDLSALDLPPSHELDRPCPQRGV